MNESATAINQSHRFRYAFLWMGWLVPQLLLLGPCLLGWRVLIPCELLALPGYYLPETDEQAVFAPGHVALTDLVLSFPMARKFATSEYREGRIPLWQPSNYCGTPFAGWPKYSPYELVYAAFPAPETLAWIQLFQNIGFGLGFWFFLTRSLSVPFWPAAIVSWCAPSMAFLALWQGYPVAPPVIHLPWLFLAADATVKRPFGWGLVGVALLTGIILNSGQPDMGGLVLLTCGLRVVWQILIDLKESRKWSKCIQQIVGLCGGWSIGFLLAGAYLLPLVDYMGEGSRVAARASGIEERPPVGINALWGLFLPESEGGCRAGSIYIGASGNILESSAGAYAGLIAVLWLAPLAIQNRPRRKEILFWSALAFVSLGWVLNVPGIVSIQRLPYLNMLSYNRWVFAAGVSIFIVTAFGLEHLFSDRMRFSRWFVAPISLCVALTAYCLWRTTALPELIANLGDLVRTGRVPGVAISDVESIQESFRLCFCTGAALGGIALVAWSFTFQRQQSRRLSRTLIAILLMGDVYFFAYLQTRQSQSNLYYPPIAALERLAELPRARVLGINCLPPSLNVSHGLWDIRGYDGVDPDSYIRLLNSVGDPAFVSPSYAVTQMYVPLIILKHSKFQVPQILNLLNTRYVIMRSQPAVDWPVVAHHDDYWVLENVEALPRVFVPETVEYVPDTELALKKMSDLSFDPRNVAYLHDPVPPWSQGRGAVSVKRENPCEIELRAEMKSDGIVIISDRWDRGWKAYVDHLPVPLWRANLALRGVAVPAGQHSVVLRYEPESVRLGFRLVIVGGICLALFVFWKSLR